MSIKSFLRTEDLIKSKNYIISEIEKGDEDVDEDEEEEGES